MDLARQTALRQQKVEELCAAAIRALTGDPKLHYRGRRLHRDAIRIPVHAPHLQLDIAKDDFGSFRGVTDSIALRLKHSDPELHRELRPDHPVERMLFELLEQLRVETLAPDTMPGMTRNVYYRFAQWSHAFHQSGLTDSDLGILIYSVAQMCWARLTGQPVLEETEDLLEPTRGAIGVTLGHDLAGLKRHREDQRAFARHALSIAGIVAGSIDAADAGDEEELEPENDAARAIFSLLINFDEGEEEGIAAASTGVSKTLADSDHTYTAYTRQYDREVRAADLVREQLLRELRGKLDRRISEQGVNIPRLARLFAALLAVPQRDGWSFAEEEGYVDGRRLAQLVSSPAERRLFRLEQYKPHAKCLISILIDCSGSMKQHIESIAMLVDILARALEQAEVKTEILGFTTGAWSGGRAQRDWVRAGQPANPGRLNEVCHMIYKDAETGWRRARRGVAALLKPDLFREGVDGEAVEWACQRMRMRAEPRKILLVISDGSPMDTATNLANDVFYLDNHLQQVVAHREAVGDIEIYGLGLGLDLSPYYSRCLAMDISTSLTNEIFFEIIQLMRGHHRR